LRIAVAATPAVAIPTLNALLASEHELTLIITQPDRPAGRGLHLQESEVSAWANSHSLTCVKPSAPAEVTEALSTFDLLLTIGYGVILPPEVFLSPRFGSLNLHFSLLPRWRGAAPVQRAIEAGDPVSGVTVFALDDGMDTGPIYTVKRFALDSDITSDELFIELGDLGVEAVLEALSAIENGKKPAAQPIDGASRAFKLKKTEGGIDWNASAEVISRKVRAFTSNPGAWTRFRDSTLKIDSVQIRDEKLAAGEISQIGRDLVVGTGTTAISIAFITPAGKPRTDSYSWLNGARLKTGEKFG